GQTSTLPATIADMEFHTPNAARAHSHALIFSDLPFMRVSTLARALDASQAVMQAGAHVVKIEGGAELAKIVSVLANN
ncbi:3-methyl-2-oxobutanoate hydroxymethyltransferase, partial [Mycobacterium tuberculosis]|nr:3-methyl-2-oxobutanoate hydroxymethyltransferase [Mycobacterium tuberculosis]